MALEDLYKQVVLEHYRRPRNYGELPAADAVAEAHNPVCGDSVTVYLKEGDGGRLADVRFSGKMCAVSQASASLMSEAVRGRSFVEAMRLRGSFEAMMRERSVAPDCDLGDLLALKSVVRYAVRVKCALLPWDGLASGIGSLGGGRGADRRGGK